MKHNVKLVIGVVLLFVLFSLGLSFKGDEAKKNLGEEVVLLLYDFADLEQLEGQQYKLKSRLTEDVYNQLTVDNEERRLNTYLKFRESTSTVEILKSNERFVIYRLHCDTIQSSRVFLFSFEVNSFGKISYVYEAEMIGFIAGERQWGL